MANEKPHVEPCGCWSWCETCKGTGEVTGALNRLKTLAQVASQCPDCKGNPQTIKHCAKHARDMGFDVDWRRTK